MKLVVLESPYAGKTPQEVEENVGYAKLCLFDCLRRGESPIAGHLLYTQVLDDKDPEQRRKGLDAHLAWIKGANIVAVYMDKGISPGMQEAIDLARKLDIHKDFRWLAKRRKK